MAETRFHIIQHVSFEGPAYIAQWIENKKYSKSFSLMFNSDPFPSHNDYDVLVVMGGPMGIYDHDKY